MPAFYIERRDLAAAERANQQTVAPLAEICWGMHHAPRSIHPFAVLEPAQQNARAIEDIHVPEPGAIHFVLPIWLLLHCERDEEIAVDVQYVEWCESCRYHRIGECAG